MIGKRHTRIGLVAIFALIGAICISCGKKSDGPGGIGEDSNVTTLGTIEVTARLTEVPPGAIFKRELYNYATVLKYKIIRVHRGTVNGDTIFVGHYNPFKPRPEAADQRVKGIGGNLRSFRGGQVHRMALDVPIDDHYMGGIINKYFGQDTGPIYWAVWTNLVSK
jgi:hypothetical protein